MKKERIYLGLGSNIGDRAENIISALSILQSSGDIIIERISSFYETSPIGPSQRDFYNIAVKAHTKLLPADLLYFLKNIESVLGRKKGKRWGSRIIDIDILFYGNSIINEKHLQIPHKEIQNRLFVLVPLKEIAKNFIHPVFKKSINDILNSDFSLTHKYQKVKMIQIY